MLIITVVCSEKGCNGNKFKVNTEDDKLILTCTECGTSSTCSLDSLNHIILPKCSKCDNENFKAFNDKGTGKMYIKCTECGNPPESIYVDKDGNQVSYEQLKMMDVESDLFELSEKLDDINEKINNSSMTMEQMYEWMSDLRSTTKKK